MLGIIYEKKKRIGEYFDSIFKYRYVGDWFQDKKHGILFIFLPHLDLFFLIFLSLGKGVFCSTSDSYQYDGMWLNDLPESKYLLLK